MDIKNLIFLLLLLLPLHTSSIESINPNEEIIIDYMEYDKIYDNVDQIEREYVIFADDEVTYETIKEENYVYIFWKSFTDDFEEIGRSSEKKLPKLWNGGQNLILILKKIVCTLISFSDWVSSSKNEYFEMRWMEF